MKKSNLIVKSLILVFLLTGSQFAFAEKICGHFQTVVAPPPPSSDCSPDQICGGDASVHASSEIVTDDNVQYVVGGANDAIDDQIFDLGNLPNSPRICAIGSFDKDHAFIIERFSSGL